jgi:hypothetical protein
MHEEVFPPRLLRGVQVSAVKMDQRATGCFPIAWHFCKANVEDQIIQEVGVDVAGLVAYIPKEERGMELYRLANGEVIFNDQVRFP